MKDNIIQGDALNVLKTIPDESIDMVMTSPPYWALRDYGVEGQLGLEPTFQEYIKNLCDIFDEVKRVLKKEGTCWVNMGDTYMGNSSYSEAGRQGYGNDKIGMINKEKWQDPKYKAAGNSRLRAREHIKSGNVRSKSLCQIPSRFAIEMTNRGWILRNEIIWHKPNCMPSSVKDRFTVDFEKIFFFVKNNKYWFETQYEKYAPASDVRYRQAIRNGKSYNSKEPYKNNTPYTGKYKRGQGSVKSRGDDSDGLVVGGTNPEGRNKRAVWKINTKPYSEAHFAVYPEELCETPIKAGCPKGGIVLDPFFGAGTTGLVAQNLNRNYLGIELNKEYIKIAEERLKQKPLL